jgi:diguanylate cyclase (GGDEF)-like protein
MNGLMARIRRVGLTSLHWLDANMAMKPEDRELGGRAGAVLWLVAGTAFSLFPAVPGYPDRHVLLTELFAGGALGWGTLCAFVIPWKRANGLISPVSALSAYLVIAYAVSFTGGSRSAIWVSLYWLVLIGCYFYPRRLGISMVVLAIVIQALPLLYDHAALRNGYIALLLMASAGYIVIGWCVLVGRQFNERLRLRSDTLAAEQVALRRAASAVMAGDEPDDVFALVSSELAKLVDCDMAGIFQCVDGERVKVIAAWTRGDEKMPPSGTLMPVVPGAPFAIAIERQVPARVSGLDERPGTIGYMLGLVSTIAAPVVIGGAVWGLIGLGSHAEVGFDRHDEERVKEFAVLLASIVTSLEERARLESQALTDQLTGLPNHRALHQRLTAELASSTRHGRQLAVVMVDVDNFKEINDAGGHPRGDEALRLVGSCLFDGRRAGDTVGRLGGDEFMWIMPDADSHQALNAIERAREHISRVEVDGRQPTTSAGICDTSSTSDPAELVRRADIALYASKASGRDQSTMYDAEVAAALEPRARGAWVERSQSLAGLRALARAVDAKDPATSEHSERVATFSGRLAQVSGWPDHRVARLREAALVHDVGKLGVPDAILTKPGRLTESERVLINEHVELSVRIVGILSDEQVSWIRAHHERPDGGGYPRGLVADQISDGAALMALADAWDVMVVGRTYNRRKSADEAFTECLQLEDKQFMPIAVDALRQLREAGWLELETGPDSAGGLKVPVGLSE